MDFRKWFRTAQPFLEAGRPMNDELSNARIILEERAESLEGIDSSVAQYLEMWPRFQEVAAELGPVTRAARVGVWLSWLDSDVRYWVSKPDEVEQDVEELLDLVERDAKQNRKYLKSIRRKAE